MKASIKQGGDFTPAPSGTHPAVLTQLLDLGTQSVEFQNEKKLQRKVRMVFELHGEDTLLDDGKPMVVGREFTLSSHEKAGLRVFIEGWRGKNFTDDEAAEFDYKLMLGKPCLLNVAHTKADNGKTYAKVTSASRLVKGMLEPTGAGELIYFYMGTDESGFSEYDAATFEALAAWLKDKIRLSPEYAKATGQYVDETRPDLPEPSKDVPFDDEIPF